MTQIGGRLKYIKSGTTGHTFKGLSNNNDVKDNYAVKIVAYPKKANYGNVYDIRRPENAEIMMLRTLSYFVIKKQTPHIVLPVGTFNTSIKPFLTLSEKQYRIIKSLLEELIIKRTISVKSVSRIKSSCILEILFFLYQQNLVTFKHLSI